MKWCGKLGFVSTQETSPGVYKQRVVEKTYKGFVTKNNRTIKYEQVVNESPSMNININIYINPYLQDNIYSIKYLTYMHKKWKITDIEIQYPRVNLRIGGLYFNEDAD